MSRGGHVIYAWGSVRNGRIPIGRTSGTTAPVRIPVPPQYNYVKVASHTAHALALTECGKVFAWGSNRFGQLGDGSTLDALDPVLISGLTNVRIVDISVGPTHSAAVDDQGGVWVWGASSAVGCDAPWLGRPTATFPRGRGATMQDPSRAPGALAALSSAISSLSIFRRPLVVPRRLATFGGASAGDLFPDFTPEPMGGKAFVSATPTPSTATPTDPSSAPDAAAAAAETAATTDAAADATGGPVARPANSYKLAPCSSTPTSYLRGTGPRDNEIAGAAPAAAGGKKLDPATEAALAVADAAVKWEGEDGVADDADEAGDSEPGGLRRGLPQILPVWTATYVAERLEHAAKDEVCQEAWLGVGPLPFMSSYAVWPKRRKELLSDDWEVRERALKLSGPIARAWVHAVGVVPGADGQYGSRRAKVAPVKPPGVETEETKKEGEEEAAQAKAKDADDAEAEGEGEEEEEDSLGGLRDKWVADALQSLKDLVHEHVMNECLAATKAAASAAAGAAEGTGAAKASTGAPAAAVPVACPASADGHVHEPHTHHPTEVVLLQPEAKALGADASRTARIRAVARAAARTRALQDESDAAAAALGVASATKSKGKSAAAKAGEADAAEAIRSGGFSRWAKTQQRVVFLARWRMDAGNGLLMEEAQQGKDELDFAVREGVAEADEEAEAVDEDEEGGAAKSTRSTKPGAVVGDEPPIAAAVAQRPAPLEGYDASGGAYGIGGGASSGGTTPTAPLAVKVACGEQMTAVITDDGTVYTFGAWRAFKRPFGAASGSLGSVRSNVHIADGRLGTLPPREHLDIPERVPLARRHAVTNVAVAHNHTLLLSQRGYMFGSGTNTSSQLGGVAPRRSLLPRVIPSLTAAGRTMQPAVAVAARGRSSAMVSADGSAVLGGAMGATYMPLGGVHDGMRDFTADVSRKFVDVAMSPGFGTGHCVKSPTAALKALVGAGGAGTPREQHAVLVNDVGQLFTVGSDVCGETSAKGGGAVGWISHRLLPGFIVSPIGAVGRVAGRVVGRVVEDVEAYVHRNRPADEDDDAASRGKKRAAAKKAKAEPKEGEEGEAAEGEAAEAEAEMEEEEPEEPADDGAPKKAQQAICDGTLEGTRSLLAAVAAMQAQVAGPMGRLFGVSLPASIGQKPALELAQQFGLPVEVAQSVTPFRVAVARAALGVYAALTGNGARAPRLVRHKWLQDRNLKVVNAEAGDGVTYAIVAPADSWHFVKHLKLLAP